MNSSMQFNVNWPRCEDLISSDFHVLQLRKEESTISNLLEKLAESCWDFDSCNCSKR